MDQLKVLKSKFDIAMHKATFVNYLEVVIANNGAILYAHPGHNEVMERIAEAKGILPDDCPRSRWLDYDDWLREITGCVCVWTGGYVGNPNDRQREALAMLVREGLLRLGDE